eukprot:724931-Amphidinium_carterae.2
MEIRSSFHGARVELCLPHVSEHILWGHMWGRGLSGPIGNVTTMLFRHSACDAEELNKRPETWETDLLALYEVTLPFLRSTRVNPQMHNY